MAPHSGANRLPDPDNAGVGTGIYSIATTSPLPRRGLFICIKKREKRREKRLSSPEIRLQENRLMHVLFGKVIDINSVRFAISKR